MRKAIRDAINAKINSANGGSRTPIGVNQPDPKSVVDVGKKQLMPTGVISARLRKPAAPPKLSPDRYEYSYSPLCNVIEKLPGGLGRK